ncbi:S-layer homology domain-containing protein [Paenisporosarcina sp.]|uniref:S-layer homology domain-containing protein n=1 Tax=Paenisporosarcina sp. TaxID=1932001 RepID=UPI003C76E510
MAYQPKSYKKFVATAATATLVASAVAPLASAAFSDVADRYKEAVAYLADNGIASGYPNGKFGTDDNIKRQDAAVMIARALGGSPTGEYANAGFTDVPADRQWAVNFLVEKKIVSGKAAGQFGANDFTTRGEMAKIIANAYNFVGDATNAFPFTDVSETFKEFVDALEENGIAQGYAGTTKFGTGDNVTRGQFALFVFRAEAGGVTEATVASAKALNSKQIEVKFNTTLNSTTSVVGDASEAALYTLDGNEASSAVLSADKKSVVLTFANDVEGADQVLVVNPIVTEKKDETGAWVKTDKYSQVFSFTDTVKPVITNTSYANGKITLTFSEDLSQLPTVVRVNGTPVSTIAFAAGSTSKVEVTTQLAAGTSATLFVAGAKDSADRVNNYAKANEMDLYNGSVVTPGADTEKPRVASVEVTGQNTAKVTLSEDVVEDTIVATLQQGATQTGVNLVRDTTDATGKTYTLTVSGLFTGNTTSESFTLFVAANAMSDLANPANKNDFFSTTVTFVRDTVAPVLASSQVGTDNKKLEFTFNESLVVKGSDSNIVITNGEGVRVTAVDADSMLKVNDDKTYQVDTKEGDFALDAGTYTVSIPAGFFEDAYGNASSAVSRTFTVGTASSTDKVKPTAGVTTTGKNQFTVTFNEEVTSSGINLANYKVDGQALPAGTDIYFTSAAKTQVVIALPTNSVNIGDQTNGATGVLTVSGVADKAGNVINSSNYNVVLKDNTAATVAQVQSIGSDVYVTFNENVTFGTGVDADAVFNITVNGVVVSASNLQTVAGNAKQVKFTLDAAPATTPVVTVKATQTALTDANGTPVK